MKAGGLVAEDLAGKVRLVLPIIQDGWRTESIVGLPFTAILLIDRVAAFV
ncbi:MAG: hypothetical protein ACI97A_000579 [Planctomycetota bacterium]